VRTTLVVAVLTLVPATQLAQTSQSTPRFKGVFESVSYPEDIRFADVFFVDKDMGWVAGGNGANDRKGGAILYTRDGGANWTVQYGGDPDSSDPGVRELRFLDARTGWGVQNTGGPVRLLRTTDGETWTSAGTMAQNFADYAFTSPQVGVFVDSGRIHRTENGGATWKPVGTCSARVEVNGLIRSIDCIWQRLQFVTPLVGFASGRATAAQGVVILGRTDDGGATWTVTSAVAASRDHVNDMFFLSENTGFVHFGSPHDGPVFRTDDGGKTWSGIAASPGVRLVFADPEVGWTFYGNRLSFTADGGKRWSSRDVAFPALNLAFSLPRRDRGYVVGDHGMIFRYRVVPIAESVPKAIAAPVMPVFDSPLDDQVQKLETQLSALEKIATAGGSSDTVPAGFADQLSQIETTLVAASTEAPQFATKYRNLNLFVLGLQMATELPAQVQGLRDVVQKLKQERSLKAAVAGVPDLRARTDALSQMIRKCFQDR
jgi:photosystem II stability/assembly factor-like uncharacterized protein